MIRLFDTPRFQNFSITALRISLGLIYGWFGGLKVFGYNPVYEIVHASFPLLATPNGNIVLGLFETAIGIGLLLNLFPRVVNMALIIHLIGTFSVFFQAPGLMFQPQFPILTLAGEFVFKNVTLAAAGLVVLAFDRK